MQAVCRDPALTPSLGTPALHLFRPYVRDPWPLTAEQRHAIVDSVLDILARGKNARDRIAAARLILEMDWINLEQLRLGGRTPR
jgi:hypothetical protein